MKRYLFPAALSLATFVLGGLFLTWVFCAASGLPVQLSDLRENIGLFSVFGAAAVGVGLVGALP